MRIFVSSSFEDLKEHRVAAIRVLRQLGHEVIAMEDMTAGSLAPLAKVLEMVDRSEAYVGIFAWRYGFAPQFGTDAAPFVAGATPGETSITDYEYLHAVERGLPVMAFLLDERWPWPPEFVDGFDQTRTGAQPNTEKIRALRLALKQERVVSWFTTPADLEARVSAAVTTAGLTNQLDLQAAAALPSGAGVAGDSSAAQGITQAIISAGDHQRAVKIDLISIWWSTRLYLIASLAQRLTQARRILVADSSPQIQATNLNLKKPRGSSALPEERFVGQLSTGAILSVIGEKSEVLRVFEDSLRTRPVVYNDISVEIVELLELWRKAFNDDPGSSTNERQIKIDLTPEILRRWFGETMLTQPLEIGDLRRASAVDILRLLDYPNDFVPVLTRRDGDDAPTTSRLVGLVDKTALNARLSRSYLVELLDRARIVSPGPPTRTWSGTDTPRP
jgi:hypothetical protein